MCNGGSAVGRGMTSGGAAGVEFVSGGVGIDSTGY
jgi:hypothetical protein